MARSPHYVEFACPNPECDWVGYVREIPATRDDPACLDGDPPEDCPECGADMHDVDSENADPADIEHPDPDSYYDRDR